MLDWYELPLHAPLASTFELVQTRQKLSVLPHQSCPFPSLFSQVYARLLCLFTSQAPLAMIYFIMSVAFFLCTVAWAMVLRQNRDSPQLFRVHYLMLALMASKTLALFLHGIDYHYIKTTGHENKEWAALFYAVRSRARRYTQATLALCVAHESQAPTVSRTTRYTSQRA